MSDEIIIGFLKKYSDVEIGKNTFYMLFKDTAMIIDQRNSILHLDCEGTIPLVYVYIYEHSTCLPQ